MAIFTLGHHGQRTTGPGTQSHHLASSRTAWTAVVLTPVGVIVGALVAFGMAALIDANLQEPSTMSGWEKAFAYIPASLIWLSAPIIGVVAGVRAARTGSLSGKVATAVSSLLLVAMILLTINSPQG